MALNAGMYACSNIPFVVDRRDYNRRVKEVVEASWMENANGRVAAEEADEEEDGQPEDKGAAEQQQAQEKEAEPKAETEPEKKAETVGSAEVEKDKK